MKQRIGIAQALINEPDIVFMDEPASALDPMGRYDVMEILTKLKGNTTVFFSTHIISDIERVCDTIAIINKGSILEQGTISDLKTKYDNNTISVTFADYSQVKDIEKFVEMLKMTAWCLDAANSSINDKSIMIHVNDRSIAQIEIPVIIANLKLSLEFMNSHSLTLEDVFIKVVGK